MSKQNQQPIHKDFLKATVKVGCSKGNINFKSDQHVFHHDDVPEKARKRKEDVRAWLKPNILQPEPKYDLSTKYDYTYCDRRSMENYVKDRGKSYQFNFRAETLDSLRVIEPLDRSTKFHVSAQLQKTKDLINSKLATADYCNRTGYQKRTQEMPIHPALEGAKPWNNETFFDRQAYEKNHDILTQMSQEKVTRRREQLLHHGGTVYLNPTQQVKKLNQEVRAKKASDTFRWNELINRDPALDAPVNRTLLKNRYAVEKANRSISCEHSGTWEYNRHEGRYMWTDTGSFNIESRGDIVRTSVSNKYQYPGELNASYSVHTR